MEILINICLEKSSKTVCDWPNVKGKLENDIITFEHEEMYHQIDLKNKTFMRKNKEYEFWLDVNNNESYIKLYKENVSMPILVEKTSWKSKEFSCEITYLLETDDEQLTIKMNWEM